MGIDPLIPIATDTLNTLHTKFQTQQILDKKIDTVVIIGVGYKEKCSVPIIEESAKLKIGQELVRSGIRVIVKDIKLLIDCVKLEYGNLFEYEIVESLDDVSIVKLNMSNGYILK
jgi:hypothetical protein